MMKRFFGYPTLLRIFGILVVMVASNIWQVEIAELFAPHENRPSTLWGVLIIVGLVASFGVVTWWLYLSPIPQQVEPDNSERARKRRRFVGLAMTLSSLSFISGGLIDLLWHFWLGGFGDDFLWFPHQLIYMAFLINMVVAGSILGNILAAKDARRLSARREPALGLAALSNAFIICSVPSDLIWHQIYGIDITPWSLPHVQLVLMATISTTSAIFLLISSLKHRAEFNRVVVIAVHFLAGVLAWGPMLLIMPEYELSAETASSSILQRPGWVYPLIIFLVSYAVMLLIVSLTRRSGSLLVVTLVALCGRIAFALGATTLPILYGDFKFVCHLIGVLAAIGFEIGFFRLAGIKASQSPRQFAQRTGLLYWAIFWPVGFALTTAMRVGSPLQVSDLIVGPLLGLALVWFYGIPASLWIQRFHLATLPAEITLAARPTAALSRD